MNMLDDKGTLECFSNQISFLGRKGLICCRGIRSIDLVRQAVPWVALLLMNVLLLGMVFGGVMRTFTPDNSATVPLLVMFNVFFLLVHGAARWVRVTYADDSGEVHTAYFADGSAFGWGRICGGTTRMYHKVRAVVMVPDSGPPDGSQH